MREIPFVRYTRSIAKSYLYIYVYYTSHFIKIIVCMYMYNRTNYRNNYGSPGTSLAGCLIRFPTRIRLRRRVVKMTKIISKG